MSRVSDRINRIPAEVFACLQTGELRITLFPGYGLANGGAPLDVRLELIPFEYRLPNTPLWVTIDLDRAEVLEVEFRDPDV